MAIHPLLYILFVAAQAFMPQRAGELKQSVNNPGAVTGLVVLLNRTAFYIRDFDYNVPGEGEGRYNLCNNKSKQISLLWASLSVVFTEVGIKYPQSPELWKALHLKVSAVAANAI